MIGAVEPRYGAFVPTGAGGFWNMMILETSIVPGVRALLTADARRQRRRSDVRPPGAERDRPVRGSQPSRSSRCPGSRPVARCRARPRATSTSRSASTTRTSRWTSTTPRRCRTATRKPAPRSGRRCRTRSHSSTSTGSRSLPDQGQPRRPHARRCSSSWATASSIRTTSIVSSTAVKHQYGCFLESYLRDGVATIYAPGDVTDPCE